jgi:hypothetical protein
MAGGGSKTTHVVTAREEERDHPTITEASENVSAILLIVLVRCSSCNCSLKSQLGFEQNDQIRTLASCKRRSSCAHQPAGSQIIRVRWVVSSLIKLIDECYVHELAAC